MDSPGARHRREVGDLRFSGGILDHGRALGEHGAHQDVVGRGVAGELEHDPRADKAVAVALDVAVLGNEGGAEILERAQVEVDRTVPEVVAARHRDPGGAVAREQGAEHDDRRPHLLDELIGGDGSHVFRDRDLEVSLRASALVEDLGPHCAKHVGHDRDVADDRDVVEAVDARGEKARRHELQHGVLRPVHAHGALQRAGRAQDEAIHGETVLRQAGRDHPQPARATSRCPLSSARCAWCSRACRWTVSW